MLLSKILLMPCLLVSLALAPTPARADEAVTAARRHNKAAKQHFVSGRYEEAAAAYQKAHEARPMPIFLYNMGQCYRRGGTLARLKKSLSLFERHQRVAPDSPSKQVVQEEIEQVKREISVKEREAARQRSLPTYKPTAPTKSPGKTDDGGDRAGSRRPLYKRWWLWTAVAAVATAGAGLGLGLAARADKKKAEEQGQTLPTSDKHLWQTTVTRGKREALAANILFGTAGALAVTSVVLFLLEKPVVREQRSVRVVPAAGADSAGLSLLGSF